MRYTRRGVRLCAHLGILAPVASSPQGERVGERSISELAQSLVSEPAEDSGSETASRYNFQYLCTARHCFALLNDSRLAGIVCEWHVDYVLLYNDGTNELVSVKHREPQVGPWPFAELWSKGGLTTLYERWKATPGAKCRLVTNGSMKTGRDFALDFAKALSSHSIEEYLVVVSEKLGSSSDEAREFLLALRIEYGLPDRVALRSYQIVHNVGGALEGASITGIDATSAWDAVVNLVASKSRDLDNRDYSSIDLASPSALDADVLTSAKIARRTIRRSDVVATLSTNSDGEAAQYPIASNLWVREPSTTFIGRGEILQRITEHCRGELQTNPSVALLGMSGVGKSELLAQYAWKHAEEYRFVWWVRADSWNSIVSDLAVLTERLGLPAPDSDDGLRQLKQYFLENRGLVLLDGATPDPSTLRFIPKNASTRFLISSLDQSWLTHMPAIQVPPLIDGDATALLASFIPEVSHERLAVLSRALHGLPLALKQAAGYISVSGIPVETYSEMIRDRASELLRRSAPPDHVGLTAALSITMERVQAERPSALKLLHILAFMAAHGFPTDLFGVEIASREQRMAEFSPYGTVEIEQRAAAELKGMSEDAVRLLQALKDRLELFDAVADLQNFSLVEAQRGGISCHALTQAVIRQSLTEAERQSAVVAGTALLNKVANLSPFDSRYWPHYRHMMPHFEALIEHLESSGYFPANTLMFYSVISINLGAQGAKEASLSYAKRTVTSADQLDGISLDTRVFTRSLLAESLIGADRWDDALRVVDESFLLGAGGQLDAFSRATLHTKRAAVLHLQGKLNEAVKEFDRAHACVGSDADLEGVDSLRRALKSNMANLRRESGDAQGAIAEYLELISDFPEHSSRNDLSTLYSNLCLAYLDAMDFGEALLASHKALDIDMGILDGFHADAARDWNNAGLALLELNKPEEARTAFESSLLIHERISNRRSTIYLIARMNLGRAQIAQGDLAAARRTLEETREGQESLLGPNHRDVATTLANLSVVYSGLGLLGNAAAAAHRAIKIDVEVYGEDHPQLMVDFNNLASALMLSGNYRAALKWLNRAHAISVRAFGNENLRRGMCLHKMAVCKYASGEVSAGINDIQEALVILNAKLGAEHPETVACRSDLTQMLQRNFPFI
ncbi:dsDNA nuclease domain-containing protein [Streptomyces sp. NPDC016172]|uniref:dsDNA nuclease domain-containing protein n=1 Tax=Streptomyces sp. NPDC016172 TaxID=3364964 RepID=UPI0036F5EE1D